MIEPICPVRTSTIFPYIHSYSLGGAPVLGFGQRVHGGDPGGLD